MRARTKDRHVQSPHGRCARARFQGTSPNSGTTTPRHCRADSEKAIGPGSWAAAVAIHMHQLPASSEAAITVMFRQRAEVFPISKAPAGSHHRTDQGLHGQSQSAQAVLQGPRHANNLVKPRLQESDRSRRTALARRRPCQPQRSRRAFAHCPHQTWRAAKLIRKKMSIASATRHRGGDANNRASKRSASRVSAMPEKNNCV